MVSMSPYLEISNQVLKEASNESFIYRNLELEDYDKGFPELLPQLTVGILQRKTFVDRFNELKKYEDLIQTFVCEDLSKGKLVGTIRFFIEPKYIRNGGSVSL